MCIVCERKLKMLTVDSTGVWIVDFSMGLKFFKLRRESVTF